MRSRLLRPSSVHGRGSAVPVLPSLSSSLSLDANCASSCRNTAPLLRACRRPCWPCAALSAAGAVRPWDSSSSSLSAGVLAQLCQKRFVRPNQGRNDYRQVGGKKRSQGVEVLPETIRLLIETRQAAAAGCSAGLHLLPRNADGTLDTAAWRSNSRFPITEALRLPTIAEVNAPLEPSDERSRGRDDARRRSSGKKEDIETDSDDSPSPLKGVQRPERMRGLHKVALHCGDISRLRVDATVMGAVRSFKPIGEGRGFTGCSALLEGAGPSLPLFVAQQRQQLGEELLHTPVRGDPSSAQTVAAAAVRALRRGVHHFSASIVPAPLRSASTVPSKAEAEEMPIMELAEVAARAARLAGAAGSKARAGEGLSFPSQARGAHRISDGVTAGARAGGPRDGIAVREPALDPSQLSPPGAVLVSPGFSLPSSFLVHVVEPNAVLSNQQMLDALFRLEEREALRRKQRQLANLNASQPSDEASSDEDDDEDSADASPTEWRQGDEGLELGAQRMQLLEECYINALNAAWALGVRSVALPCLGAGVGRFPVFIAARCAARGVARWMEEQRELEGRESKDGDKSKEFDRIVFCTSSDIEWNALRKVIPQFLS
ncbi:hypothetical protein BESB_009770 [Besnoitia besnoiti]|uniref:Macro domain-containing protein n=1 Tax=Besnoitia besnoiti TaxID=94643 RepID=A0A2A9MKV5_BESBE|nr:hypothetical protein BESB_009770 [Besnoitia besnoiti]PFH38635.1 hypothetical protein BESB_009770 [Besnoitia besnoiti]